MKKLCNLLILKNDDELFDKITQSFKIKITKWGYFVNKQKVFENIKPIEKELNLLNYLIGKEDIENPKISNLYKSKIQGFTTKKQLELFLAEEPQENYSIDINFK